MFKDVIFTEYGRSDARPNSSHKTIPKLKTSVAKLKRLDRIASGGIHLVAINIFSSISSVPFGSLAASPKSDIFTINNAGTKIFRAARSLCTILYVSFKYRIPVAISQAIFIKTQLSTTWFSMVR